MLTGYSYATTCEIIDLGTAGSSSSYAIDINNSGEVVGGLDGPRAGFYWSKTTGMIKLTDPNTSVNFSIAMAINDNNQIVGYKDLTRAYLLKY